MRVAPIPRPISFDVGRYDAYGVYRFDAVVELAQRRPEAVAHALAPLLAPTEDGREYRSAAERPNASHDEGLNT